MSLNDQIANEIVAHHVRVLRVAQGTTERIAKFLGELDKQTFAALESFVDGDGAITRVDRAIQVVYKINQSGYKEIGRFLAAELRGLATYEVDYVHAMMGTLAPKTSFRKPKVTHVRAIVNEEPFFGGLLSEWIDGLAQGRFQRIRNLLRLSSAARENLPDLIRKIRGQKKFAYRDGVSNLALRSAKTLVNTTYNHVANKARYDFFTAKKHKKNSDYGVEGFVWSAVLDELTCTICDSLDGQYFEADEYYEIQSSTHPNCLPGDIAVLARDGIIAVTKRPYEGFFVVINTAGGRELRCTPNHPILTSRGWVAADLLREGDNVVCDGGRDWVLPVNENNNNVPTSIEQIHESFSKLGFHDTIPVRSSDFHGDGTEGEVDVVFTNGLLSCDSNSAGFEQINEQVLIERGTKDFEFSSFSSGDLDTVLPCESNDGIPSFVGSDYQPYLDRIVSKRRTDSGIHHVYNLQTKSGYYSANGIITHNCRCVGIPLVDVEEFEFARPKKLVYGEWLAKQPASFQDEILGPARGAMFRRGMPLKKFVDASGIKYNLTELRTIEDKMTAKKHEVNKRAKGVKPLKNFGWRPDLPDRRDHMFSLVHPVQVQLPPKLSLRDKFTFPVFDQGELGSCVANACCSQHMFVHKDEVMMSRLDLYWSARFLEGTVDEDSGVMIRDGVKALQKFGVCTEKTWPYRVRKFTVDPPAAADKEALQYRITSYSRLSSLQDFQNCLAKGYPFVFGFSVYSNIDAAAAEKYGILTMPDDTMQLYGGHAVIAIGYDTDFHSNPIFKKSGLSTKSVPSFMFECRNSWSADWGDGGHFWIPADYLNDRNLSDDFWTIRS